MTKAEVFADPAFVRLSEQQQGFVRELVENGGDKVRAAHKAYKCKDDFTARTMANRCLRKLQVKRLVDAYFQEELSDRVPEQREFGAIMFEKGQATDDAKVALEFFKLSAKVLGYDQEPPQQSAQSAPQPSGLEEDTLAELERRGLSNGSAE